MSVEKQKRTKVITRGFKNKGIYILPNLFTLAALFSGFYAIIAAMNHAFTVASVAIFIAMILDSLDGRVARLINAQSAFGAQLDSLSDIVCFGVAPALMIYRLDIGFLQTMHWGKIAWLCSFIYVACVSLRLARFNIQSDTQTEHSEHSEINLSEDKELGEIDLENESHNEGKVSLFSKADCSSQEAPNEKRVFSSKRYFFGLPCPAPAGCLAAIVWLIDVYGCASKYLAILLCFILVFLAALQVSNFPYRSFKDIDLNMRVKFTVMISLVVALVLISWQPPEVLFLIFGLYCLSGPAFWLWGLKK